MRLASQCVHAGHRASPETPEVVAPIAQTSTFLLDDEAYARMLGGKAAEALIYTRIRNPTLDVVQRRIAALEGAEACLVFASGMAAIHSTVMSLAGRGSRIVAHKELYGSTWDLLVNFLGPLGITTVLADLNDAQGRARALEGGAAVVYCESISNPTMTVADVPAIARAAKERGAKLVVDATFATPVLQRPLELGADVVVHSATKYLGGHSDLIGGAACGRGISCAASSAGCSSPAGAWIPTPRSCSTAGSRRSLCGCARTSRTRGRSRRRSRATRASRRSSTPGSRRTQAPNAPGACSRLPAACSTSS
jgi:methionine-gamma-lyase